MSDCADLSSVVLTKLLRVDAKESKGIIYLTVLESDNPKLSSPICSDVENNFKTISQHGTKHMIGAYARKREESHRKAGSKSKLGVQLDLFTTPSLKN